MHQIKKANSITDIDVNKILVSKKEAYYTKIYLNTLLAIITMMLVDHYAKDFHKWPAILKNFMKMQQCLLELIINSF